MPRDGTLPLAHKHGFLGELAMRQQLLFAWMAWSILASTCWAENTAASLEKLTSEFERYSGAKLVFEAKQLPPGQYHDSMPSLTAENQLAAARIAVDEIHKLPRGFLARIGMKGVGVFKACVSKTGDGFRPYDEKLKGYRYYGIWNGNNGLAAAYYTDEQLPLTLHHEIFHNVDRACSKEDEEPFTRDERWQEVIEGTNRYPALKISSSDLVALRKICQEVLLEDAVSDYAKKSIGEDKAETARHFQSHLADSLVQMTLRSELPGSQRLLHVLMKYEKASGGKANVRWFVDTALGRNSDSAADEWLAELRQPLTVDSIPEIRGLLRKISPAQVDPTSPLMVTAISTSHAILRTELEPRQNDTVFTVRGQEDADGVNWTLRHSLEQYREDAEQLGQWATASAMSDAMLARTTLKNLRLLARFHNFIADRWTITPETERLFDRARDSLVASIPESHHELQTVLKPLSYEELARNIQANGEGVSSALPRRARANRYLASVDEAVADLKVREAIRQVQPACVRIHDGSGVNISSQGRILTNAHVARELGAEMAIEFPDGQKFMARCVAIDRKLDLAICEFRPKEPMSFAKVAATAAKTGSPVVCIGQPGTTTPGGEPTGYQPFNVSVGKIRGYLDNPLGEQSLGRVKHDAWTYWGHSGSPIFDSAGQIVALHNSWDPSTAMRHGVPQQAIAKFLKDCESVRPERE
jgi:S1-C subfamily serine protease